MGLLIVLLKPWVPLFSELKAGAVSSSNHKSRVNECSANGNVCFLTVKGEK
jgi:hypothetical protein